METPSPPENVDLFYSVLCPGASSFKQNNLDCNNVDINDTVCVICKYNIFLLNLFDSNRVYWYQHIHRAL